MQDKTFTDQLLEGGINSSFDSQEEPYQPPQDPPQAMPDQVPVPSQQPTEIEMKKEGDHEKVAATERYIEIMLKPKSEWTDEEHDAYYKWYNAVSREERDAADKRIAAIAKDDKYMVETVLPYVKNKVLRYKP